jgi:hypothetical protein
MLLITVVTFSKNMLLQYRFCNVKFVGHNLKVLHHLHVYNCQRTNNISYKICKNIYNLSFIQIFMFITPVVN